HAAAAARNLLTLAVAGARSRASREHRDPQPATRGPDAVARVLHGARWLLVRQRAPGPGVQRHAAAQLLRARRDECHGDGGPQPPEAGRALPRRADARGEAVLGHARPATVREARLRALL